MISKCDIVLAFLFQAAFWESTPRKLIGRKVVDGETELSDIAIKMIDKLKKIQRLFSVLTILSVLVAVGVYVLVYVLILYDPEGIAYYFAFIWAVAVLLFLWYMISKSEQERIAALYKEQEREEKVSKDKAQVT